MAAPGAPGPAPAEVGADARADEAFGAALLAVLPGPERTTVFSPASIAAALRMALLGARGDTAAEIAAALRLEGPAGAGRGLRLLSGLAGMTGGALTFRAPNTVWVQAGLPLRPEFTAALATLALHQADFIRAAEEAREEINAVIGRQTAGKITDLLPRGAIDGLTRLVLASAVYLKAAWAHPFPERATGGAPFFTARGETVTVPMMHLNETLAYCRGDGYQAVVLPYQGPLAMTLILPDGPLGPCEQALAAVGLSGLLAGATPHDVELGLPRFRHRARFGLIPALRQLGIERAFSLHDADFSGITAAQYLYVSAVVHQAYIDVDERGTEAAAATAVVMRAVAYTERPRVSVTFDRPFLFAITHPPSGLPLFLGRVTQPGG